MVEWIIRKMSLQAQEVTYEYCSAVMEFLCIITILYAATSLSLSAFPSLR